MPVYGEILEGLPPPAADWVQIDEPCLATDLDEMTRTALQQAYKYLLGVAKIGDLACELFWPAGRQFRDRSPLAGAGIACRSCSGGRDQLVEVLKRLPQGMSLSLGLVDGRNIWKTDLRKASEVLRQAASRPGRGADDRRPVVFAIARAGRFGAGIRLGCELRAWLAFGRQKLAEIVTLAHSIDDGNAIANAELAENAAAMQTRRQSPLARNADVRRRMDAVTLEHGLPKECVCSSAERFKSKALSLPLFPTTTIGSFAQTPEVRAARAKYKRGELSQEQYDAFLRKTLADTIRFQEEVGLDVLVHGEAERNDMVEYFGEQLSGFAFTGNGWVQSYGSSA